jgi:hypothetical protein
MEHEPAGPVTPPSRPDEPAADEGGTGLPPEEEPNTTGTLFIMIFFLMALAGMWGIMYLTLLNR